MGIAQVLALERVGADQFRQFGRLVRGGGPDRTHFQQQHVPPALRDLPGSLATRETAADHQQRRLAHRSAPLPLSGEGRFAAPGEGRFAAPGEGRFAAPGEGRFAAPGEGRFAAPGGRFAERGPFAHADDDLPAAAFFAAARFAPAFFTTRLTPNSRALPAALPPRLA